VLFFLHSFVVNVGTMHIYWCAWWTFKCYDCDWSM